MDAPKHISLEELNAYTDRFMSSMRQIGASIPPILVMYVSEAVAEVVGVGCTGVIRHNYSAVSDLHCYYEIWLVGQAGFADYVLALQGIVQDVHHGNALSEATTITH